MGLYPLSIIIACGLIYPARMLQIFNGTLSEITCSAAVPVFRLMDQEREYDPRDYNQLPDLFDIEAIPSPSRDNITLVINGSDRSNNVTIKCRNEDSFSGQFQTLFTLILEFVSILPAPNNVTVTVQYSEDPAGHLEILWEPPILDYDQLVLQNISIMKDSRIIHYTVYISTEESTIVQVYNASGTYFAIAIDKIPCSFWFQVAAVNPGGMGECSSPQNLSFNLHTGCMDSTRLTTIIDSFPTYSGLSASEIAAIIIAAVLIITALLVTLIILAKLKNDGHRNVIPNLKSELNGDKSDLNDTPVPVTPHDEKEEDMEAGHPNSGNEDEGHTSESIKRGSSYSQEGPPAGLYYAEINVITKRKNQEVEDASHHEYAVLEKPNQIIESHFDLDGDDNPQGVDN